MSSKLDSGTVLRNALRALPPGAAHASAAHAPELTELYAPDNHERALDPDRSLVIGNRGVGKSFWSAVLADRNARRSAASAYPRLMLERTEVVLGFHEAAGKIEGPAPSPEVLQRLLKSFVPQQIWRAVLWQALGPHTGVQSPMQLSSLLPWIEEHLETVEAGFRHADKGLSAANIRFVLLFDALDRLGADWSTIRRLTEGVLRFALDLRGYRALRVKLFMRTDQFHDKRLFRFPDASKLRAEYVDLKWRRQDLYGLLYRRLWLHPKEEVQAAFRVAARNVLPRSMRGQLELSSLLGVLPPALKNDEEIQEKVFSALAGLYMGANPRRGRTYLWLHNHLADAFGETSPRSFLIALQRAAEFAKPELTTALDHHALRAGVQAASGVRLDQLKEDYAWIGEVFEALARLEVPCFPKKFTESWRRSQTVTKIREFTQNQRTLGPLEIEDDLPNPEEALLLALSNIGVLDRRPDGKINIPDIFRVAADMKRRGGVRPTPKR